MILQLEKDVETEIHLRFVYPNDSVALQYEHERDGEEHKHVLPQHPLEDEDTTIHIYVSNLDERLARIKEHKFHVYIEPMELVLGTRAAVVLDPLGIKVRLMENEEQFPVNVVKKNKKLLAHSRLAYVQVSVEDYDQLNAAAKIYEGIYTRLSFFRHDHKKGNRMQSYRPVDMERFVERLTTYLWFGNGMRSETTTFCLVHKCAHRTSEASESVKFQGDYKAMHQVDFANGIPTETCCSGSDIAGRKVFLGVQFIVHSIQEAVAQLKTCQEQLPGVHLDVYNVQGKFPRFSYFLDPAYIPVQMTDNVVSTTRSFIDAEASGGRTNNTEKRTGLMSMFHNSEVKANTRSQPFSLNRQSAQVEEEQVETFDKSPFKSSDGRGAGRLPRVSGLPSRKGVAKRSEKVRNAPKRLGPITQRGKIKIADFTKM